MKPPRLTRYLFFVFIFIILLLQFLRVVPKAWDQHWDIQTQLLVTNSAYIKAKDGPLKPMYYPFDLHYKTPLWKSDNKSWPYYSQFGFIPMLLAKLAPKDTLQMERYLLKTSYVFAALTALILSILIVNFWLQFGGVVGMATLFASLFFPTILNFLPNAYWVLCLSIALFAWPWILYPLYCQKKVSKILFFSIFFLLFFIRFLCGYEHCLVLATHPFAALVYHVKTLRVESARYKRDLLRFSFTPIFAIFFALLFHSLQLISNTHSYRFVWENTLGNAARNFLGLNISLKEQLFGIYGTFAHDKPITLLTSFWLLSLIYRKITSKKLSALHLATFITFISCLSWLIIVRQHIVPQYNFIIFYYGFIYLAVASIIRKA